MPLIEFAVETPAGDRQAIDEAVEHYARIGQVHVAPDLAAGFAYAGRIHAQTMLAVGELSISASRVTRTPDHATHAGLDVLGIVLNPSEIEVTLDGAAAFRYGQGEAFLWQADRAGSSRYLAPQTRLLNIALPREILASGLHDLESIAGRRIPPSAELNLLKAYARAFLDSGSALGAEAVQTVHSHLQDLALLALGASRDTAAHARGRGVRAARLAAIKADIEAHLLDPQLSVAWVLRRHRISERYLRILFAEEARSFSDFVLERRLARAWLRLTDPRQRGTPVGVIAAESGFGDPSWFNRAFRRHYGMSPSDARARACGGSSADVLGPHCPKIRST